MPAVSMTVNGKAVTADADARTLLVQYLREGLRLTGTHVGCDTSQCGACVVHVERQGREGLHDVRLAGRRRERHRPSRGWRRTARCIRCRKRSARITACSAASARPA